MITPATVDHKLDTAAKRAASVAGVSRVPAEVDPVRAPAEVTLIFAARCTAKTGAKLAGLRATAAARVAR